VSKMKRSGFTNAELLIAMAESWDDENASSEGSGEVAAPLTPEQENFADSVLDSNEQFVPLATIRDDVVRALGEQAREPFLALLTFKVVPNNKGPFVEFFKGRTDMVSRTCYRKLTEDDKEQTFYQP